MIIIIQIRISKEILLYCSNTTTECIVMHANIEKGILIIWNTETLYRYRKHSEFNRAGTKPEPAVIITGKFDCNYLKIESVETFIKRNSKHFQKKRN